MTLVLFATASAAAPDLPDGLYSGVGGAFGAKRGTEVTVFGHLGGSDRAYLRRPLEPTDPVLISTANDNHTYWYIADAWLWGGWPYLYVDGMAYAASTSGRRPAVELWISIPDHAADRLTDVPRRDRTELGQGLRGRFSMPDAELGQAMPITLELSHDGEPVAMTFGGRQRGPRNNRFSFEVFLDGQELPGIDAPDFGGLSTTVVLHPGDGHTLQADLASWVQPVDPGTYEVRCTYVAQLMAPTDEPWARKHLHRQWDKPLIQTLLVDVR